jgi:hypothetical protein
LERVFQSFSRSNLKKKFGKHIPKFFSKAKKKSANVYRNIYFKGKKERLEVEKKYEVGERNFQKK